MRVLITGANGQLGHELCSSKPKDVEIFAFNKNEFNITDPKKCHLLINKIHPDLLINCAAYTNVDEAESNINYIRSQTSLPVFAGFGIKTPDDASSLSKISDGVIVGSSLVEMINNHSRKKEFKKIYNYLNEISKAISL